MLTNSFNIPISRPLNLVSNVKYHISRKIFCSQFEVVSIGNVYTNRKAVNQKNYVCAQIKFTNQIRCAVARFFTIGKMLAQESRNSNILFLPNWRRCGF